MTEFQDNGYVGTSIDSIAVRAGVSKPTIYRYFGSKQELFLTVVGERLVQAYSGLEAKAAQITRLRVRAGLIEYLRHWVEIAVVDRSILGLRRLVTGEVHRFPELGERWAAINIEHADAPLCEALRVFAARGDLEVDDFSVAMRQLIAMTLGSVQLIATFRPRYPLGDELDGIVESGVDTFLSRFGGAGGVPTK